MEATRVIRIFFFGYSNLEHFYFKQPQTETNPKPKQPQTRTTPNQNHPKLEQPQTRTTPNQNNPKLEPSQGTFFFYIQYSWNVFSDKIQ